MHARRPSSVISTWILWKSSKVRPAYLLVKIHFLNALLSHLQLSLFRSRWITEWKPPICTQIRWLYGEHILFYLSQGVRFLILLPRCHSRYCAPQLDLDEWPALVALTSTHNIPIENMWMRLRKHDGHNIQDTLLDGKHNGKFNPNNLVHV